jgi:hypothetical protein
MTATALPSQRTAARSRPGALGKVKKIFFTVAPAYLFMIIPAIVLFTFFIIYPRSGDVLEPHELRRVRDLALRRAR